MRRLYPLAVLTCVLAGCVAQTGMQGRIAVLRSGSFEESRQAGKAVLDDPRFSCGVTMEDVIGILGPPDFQTADGKDICYKTGGGPLWLAFHENRLIKKGIVSPGRWRGTDADLAMLWAQKRKTDTWYEW